MKKIIYDLSIRESNLDDCMKEPGLGRLALELDCGTFFWNGNAYDVIQENPQNHVSI